MKRNNMIFGIDEAGRGPVLGPLIIAGVEIYEKDIELLREINVRDSKELSFNNISFLFKQIKKIANNVFVEIIDPYKINAYMMFNTLNEIEYAGFSKLIEKTKASKIFIDAFYPNANKLKVAFNDKFPKKVFVVEHGADSKYEVVSAASIIAKYYREREMDAIRKKYEKYGDIGSGYPSDRRTITFLENFFKENKKFPEEARTMWSTIYNIKGKIKQKRLF